jgi:hypothetical protein
MIDDEQIESNKLAAARGWLADRRPRRSGIEER